MINILNTLKLLKTLYLYVCKKRNNKYFPIHAICINIFTIFIYICKLSTKSKTFFPIYVIKITLIFYLQKIV